MFDQTAPAYDRMNALLSLGMDAGWRRATLRALDLHAGERVLDVAAGTGASSMPLVAAGAHVAAVDFSAGMIAEGKPAMIRFMAASGRAVSKSPR